MIFCRELLFLHVPKTGGMSVSEYLVRVLPPPVYYTRPDGHGLLTVPEGVVEMSGKRHETLAQACDVVAAHGFRLPEFRAILATIRNPYDLEVSRYTHLQQPYSVNRGRIWAAAMNEDFPTFARTTITHLN